MDYPNLKPLDELDRKIVRTLQADGRISNVELARRVSLSPPAVHARIRRLEEQGYITGYRGMVQREYLGYDMLCFVHIGTALNSPEQIGEVRSALAEIPEVLECHHITGDFDYLIKVVVRNRQDLDHFVVNKLATISGIDRINTSIVLTEVKNTTQIPVVSNTD
ncbi:MAG: Lrp/AsnC family transcriptional regulator [Caldilineaceae bacterium]|nr:Lrp/AsnC family transcriptional regulator [Caldilineaceae bacterium]